MPAEWEPHEATWLAWPHAPLTWPGRLPEARTEFIQLVRAIAEVEPVFVLAGNEEPDYAIEVQRQIDANNVNVLPIATNDSWARDYGPTFVIESANPGDDSSVENHPRLAARLWQFNAWGGKYEPFDADAAAAGRICEARNIPARQIDLVFEGGAIETNGQGTAWTTTSCALNPTRNPDLDASEVFSRIRLALGLRRLLAASGADVTGDDTDGHVDQLIRFVDESTLVVATTHSGDEQFASLNENRVSVEKESSMANLQLELVPLPVPRDPVIVDGNRLPASYCNFYFCNDRLLVPQFGCAEDERALGQLRELCPHRQVIGLPSRYLLVGLGSFHCLTQQQPRPRINAT